MFRIDFEENVLVAKSPERVVMDIYVFMGKVRFTNGNPVKYKIEGIAPNAPGMSSSTLTASLVGPYDITTNSLS